MERFESFSGKLRLKKLDMARAYLTDGKDMQCLTLVKKDNEYALLSKFATFDNDYYIIAHDNSRISNDIFYDYAVFGIIKINCDSKYARNPIKKAIAERIWKQLHEEATI